MLTNVLNVSFGGFGWVSSRSRVANELYEVEHDSPDLLEARNGADDEAAPRREDRRGRHDEGFFWGFFPVL